MGLLHIVPEPLEPALTRKGAVVSHQRRWQPHVEVDGRIVTGQNPASVTGLVERMLEVQAGELPAVACEHLDLDIGTPHVAGAHAKTPGLYYLVKCRQCGHEALRSAPDPSAPDSRLTAA